MSRKGCSDSTMSTMSMQEETQTKEAQAELEHSYTTQKYQCWCEEVLPNYEIVFLKKSFFTLRHLSIAVCEAMLCYCVRLQ